MNLIIRPAEPTDVHSIFKLIKELALYEKAPEQVSNTENELSSALFKERLCHAVVAELKNEVVGFALYYSSYSTWKGPCLYLEDFYVQETHRNKGIGQLLFKHILAIAKENGVKRMDWQVLEWNKPAIDFYKKQAAILDPEWINGRLFFD